VTSSGAPALSMDLLAIVVAIVGFGISGVFLLLLLPDAVRAVPQPLAAAAGGVAVPTAQAAPAPQLAPAGPEIYAPLTVPLGEVGGSPRFARHLPIERDGGTHFLAVEQVVAVHANAHYTYVFDGTDKLFCPLAIGAVESRLDAHRFVRVHRSHIVAIDRVVGYRRFGDNEMVEMAGVSHYLVPVSRSRIGSLKSRVASQNGIDPDFLARRRHRLAVQQERS
jgi:diguanylate cyclase